jgi:hypothetical protein
MSQQIEIDELVTNLTILSKLEQNKKIMAKDTLINIESTSYIPEGIRRTMRGDSRDVTVKKVDNIIMKSIRISKQGNFDIKDYIINAKKGIMNLKETYSDCQQTQARLSTILDKIERHINNQSVEEEDNSDFE